MLEEASFGDHVFELINGEKNDSVWLIVNDEKFLVKNKSFANNNVVWECRFERSMGCRFKMETGLDDNDNIYINWMYNTRVHTCTQDGIDVWVHKFKNEVKCAMKQDFRARYAKV